MNDSTEVRIPIYTSYSTFSTCLDWLHEMPVLPSRIDRSLWGSKFGGGNGSQLMGGLRWLGLLRGEEPTESLEAITKADSASRADLLAAILRDAYGADLIQQLPRMTPKMVEDQLMALGSTDATLRKALSFLVNAVRAANLPMAPAISKRARNKPGRAASKSGANRNKTGVSKQNGAKPDQPAKAKEPLATESPSMSRVIPLRSGGTVMITAAFDLFKLSDYDRQYVLNVVDLANSYEPTPAVQEADREQKGAVGA